MLQISAANLGQLTWHRHRLSGAQASPLACPLSSCPLPFLTAHLWQLEEHGLKARMSPLSVGYQRDEQDVLRGEEGQVVGGRVGAAQPVGAEGAGTEQTGPTQKGPRTPPQPGACPQKAQAGVKKPLPIQTIRDLSKDLIVRLSLKQQKLQNWEPSSRGFIK